MARKFKDLAKNLGYGRQNIGKKLILFIDDDGFLFLQIAEKYNSISSIKAIGADGCPVNTAKHQGAIRHFEVFKRSAVQWIICGFHNIELVLRKVFTTIDGETHSGEVYTGPIGKIISGSKNRGLGLVERHMIVDFTPIKGEVRQLHPSYLQNADVRNLHTVMLLVQSGPSQIDDHFSITTGPVNQARWVTTATNIMCLYMITEDPWDDLVIMAEFIVKVYGPTICDIKQDCHVSCGPINFFKSLKRSREMFKYTRPVVWEAIQDTLTTNGFWAHIENILLAMVCDTNPLVREEGVAIIEEVRQKQRKSRANGVRKFIVPEIDFEANSYHTMIDLHQFIPVREFVSPPLLDSYSIQDIKAMNFSDNFKRIMSHQQHVERWVANTSVAAKYAVGQERRHEFLLNMSESFGKVSTDPTKKEFKQILKRNEELEKKR